MEISAAAVKTPSGSQAIPTGDNNTFTTPPEPQPASVVSKPTPALETGAALKPRSRSENKPKPRRRVGLLTILSIMAVTLLLLGWLAYDRDLNSAQAWQDRIGQWWQSSGAAAYFKRSAGQSRDHYQDTRSPSYAPEPAPRLEALIESRPEPEPLLQAEAPVEPEFDAGPEALPQAEFLVDPVPNYEHFPQSNTQIEPEPEPKPESGSLSRLQTAEPSSELQAQQLSTLTDDPQEALSSTAVPSKIQIVFGFDSDVLSEDAKETLNVITSTFTQSGSGRIRVMGYADERGDRNYNIALSRRRADAVAQYLVEGGVGPEFLMVLGLGIYNATETGQEGPTASNVNGRIVQLEVLTD